MILGWSSYCNTKISLASNASLPLTLLLSITLIAYYFSEFCFILANNTFPNEPTPSTFPKLYNWWISAVEVKT